MCLAMSGTSWLSLPTGKTYSLPEPLWSLDRNMNKQIFPSQIGKLLIEQLDVRHVSDLLIAVTRWSSNGHQRLSGCKAMTNNHQTNLNFAIIR